MKLTKRKSFFALLLISVLCLAVIYGQIKSSKSQEEAKESKEKLSSGQIAEIKRLTALLLDENLKLADEDKFVENIRLVGQKRIVEAIPILIQLLEFKHKNPYENSATGFGRYNGMIGSDYPATSALFQIGKPALPALVEVIKAEDITTRRYENALYTIQSIFRDDLSKSVEHLEKIVAETSEEPSKTRLQNAVEKINEKLNRLKSYEKNQ